MVRGAFTGLLLTALLGAACSLPPRPDFRRLYDFGDAPAAQPPVIVIPGILGSRLRERASGRELWPGSIGSLLFGDKAHLALAFDPESLQPLAPQVEAYDLFEGAFGQDFYGEILRTLEDFGRYRRTQPGTPVQGVARRYYVFAYDWRQDNVETARKLDALIEQIRRDHDDPALRVDIVAHSMGGLVTRYFLRYGARDVLDDNALHASFDGVRKVRAAILLGTPNLGSANSLHSFLVGADVGLRRVPSEVLATMPSAYQLFPHPLNAWLVTPQGEELERDLFDVEVWRRFGWSVFGAAAQARIRARLGDPAAAAAYISGLQRYFHRRLERARRFVWALTREFKDTPERLIVFGGDCTLTPARLLVEEHGGDSVVRLHPRELRHPLPGVDYSRLMLEPGDGQVTKPSLLARESLNPAIARHRYAYFPLAYAFFLCEDHSRLTGNPSFQDNLLNVLLSRERLFDQKE